MPELLTAIFEGQPAAGAPEWVHLMPLGHVTGRDGRQFTVDDPEAILAQFELHNADLPIDYEHQSETDVPNRSGPIPAAGWIKELALKPDGIWGRVEWTEKARSLIAEKAYRYLSLVMLHLKGEQSILRLKGAGLVHHPNLLLTALASQEETMADERPFLHRIGKRLGLADGATEDEIMQALEDVLSKSPDPEKYVPVEALQSALIERNTQVVNQTEAHVQAKVGGALSSGYITPAMKSWAVALCRQNEASFDAFLEKSGKPFAALTAPILPKRTATEI